MVLHKLLRCQFLDEPALADLWLLNSCTVKNPSEDNFRNSIKKAKEWGKHVVLAGCVSQGQPNHASLRGLSIIGVSSEYFLFYVNVGKALICTCDSLLKH